ncbi:MAG: methyltransferase (TIGR00027 family) [Hyphomicrobiaceae bacterium]|jgi:methyltransferase (TIGR00027 family)
MREGWPSLTAAFVAFGRGVGLSDDRRDKLASGLSPFPFSLGMTALQYSGWGREPARLLLRAASFGLVDHTLLRMEAIDDSVRRAMPTIEQVVVLGAGLDTRAWRMNELAHARVFEIDHPDTQAWKRSHVNNWRPAARQVSFVSVDFERDELGRALYDVAHDPNLPTLWIWEGVTMYLERAAIDATLTQIAERSAANSRLLVTYTRPNLLGATAMANGVVAAAFRLLGEPLRGLFEPEELADRLAKFGFEVVADTDSAQWAGEASSASWLPDSLRVERLAEAVCRVPVSD